MCRVIILALVQALSEPGSGEQKQKQLSMPPLRYQAPYNGARNVSLQRHLPDRHVCGQRSLSARLFLYTFGTPLVVCAHYARRNEIVALESMVLLS